MSDKKQFNIHDVKRVIYLYDEKQVNDYLHDGWYLLSAGFPTKNGESDTCCILGNLLKKNPKTPENERFEKLFPDV